MNQKVNLLLLYTHVLEKNQFFPMTIKNGDGANRIGSNDLFSAPPLPEHIVSKIASAEGMSGKIWVSSGLARNPQTPYIVKVFHMLQIN